MHDRHISPDEVCVVVVHYGDPSLARQVVRDVRSSDVAPGAVLVVDNGPAASRAPDWIDAEAVGAAHNRGYAGAVNLGAREALRRGMRAIWVLNNDVQIRPGALGSLVAGFNRTGDADIVGSWITAHGECWFGGGWFSPRTGRAGHLRFGEKMECLREDGRIERTGWINGCSMLIPLDSWVRRGPFDEHLFLYKEELEWQTRAPRAAAVVVRTGLVEHAYGSSTGGAEGRLGRLFMVRNAWILAARQSWATSAVWTAFLVWDFVVKPMLKGKWVHARDAVYAFTLRSLNGHEVLEKV